MGYYKVKQRTNGDYMFNLHAGNHQIILTSQGYKSKDSCMNGVVSCQNNSSDDGKYERKTSSNDKDYFSLKAANGKIIGSSEMYERTAGMENGVESCKKHGPSTEVKED